jgi:trk system potassium uptake protein TrkH
MTGVTARRIAGGRWRLRRLRAAELLILSFAAVIAAGTLLLRLPVATRSGQPLPLIDAFFTAASATCVTGLAVFDAGARLSHFGQLVLLSCIQIGGLGLMTLTTVFGVMLGHRLGITDRAGIEAAFHHSPRAPMIALVRYVIVSTVLTEAAAAVVLAAHWKASGRFEQWSTALYHGVFHSVSAFCNAGFSLYQRGMVEFRDDPVTLLVISGLIVAGGLGFLVGLDILQLARSFVRSRRQLPGGEVAHRSRLSVHTKLVVVVTSALLAIGTLSYYLLERTQAFAGMSEGQAWLNAWFCAVTPRTAGFNTVDYGTLGAGTLLCTMVLMMIGASPGSTGGGIKTSTFGVLIAYAISRMRGFSRVHLFRRTIPQESIDRAGGVVVLSIALVVLAASALMVTELYGLPDAQAQQRFVPVLFETISAFGTVGLSMNLTADLTAAGKVLIAVVMFLGRVGPLTLALAITARRAQPQFRYAEENLMIG